MYGYNVSICLYMCDVYQSRRRKRGEVVDQYEPEAPPDNQSLKQPKHTDQPHGNRECVLC